MTSPDNLIIIVYIKMNVSIRDLLSKKYINFINVH